jgi:Tol biopolymer transport system component
VSPDGLSIAFTQNDVASIGHVVIHTLADGAERILFAGAGESDPAFDASGTRIAVVTRAYGAPEIVIRDVATGALVQRLTHLDGLGATPAFAR